MYQHEQNTRAQTTCHIAISYTGSRDHPLPSTLTNQSKVLTEPHTGNEEATSQHRHGVANPASRSDAGLGGGERVAKALGRLGPNLKHGTVCICGMNGLRKGKNTT